MNVEQFQELLDPVINEVAGKPLNKELAGLLNEKFPAGSETYKSIEAACHEAIADGWMCAQGGEGRRFGRVIEARPEMNDLSVDVVQLKDIVGPHHRHPTGEICLTMPETPGATFDGQGAGWCVNEPGSAHRPTVRGGQALILYFLPGGQIEFTGR